MKWATLSPISNQTPFVFAERMKAGFWRLKTRLLVPVYGLLRELSMSDHDLLFFGKCVS